MRRAVGPTTPSAAVAPITRSNSSPIVANILVDDYLRLVRDHPHTVPEAIRRLSRVIPASSRANELPGRGSATAAAHVVTASDAEPDALLDHIRSQMRQSLKGGAPAEAQEFARRLRMRVFALLAAPAAHTGAELGELLLETGTVAAICQRPFQALADYARALRLAASRPELRNAIALRAAVINAAYGRLHEAARLLELATSPLPAAGAEEPLELLARTLIAVERLDGDAARLLDRLAGADLGKFWPFEVLGRTRWQLAQGFYTAVLNLVALAEAEHGIVPETMSESVLAFARSTALTHLGHSGTALEVLDSVAVETPEIRLSRGRARLQLGDDERAEELVDVVLRDEETGPVVSAEAALLKLWILDRRRSDASSWSASLANRAVSSEGLVRALTSVPGRISSMVSSDITPRVDIPEPRSAVRLRSSQLAVLRELRVGGSLSEIADRLQLSVNTVRTHAKAIYRRLGVHTREDAVALARSTGLLS